MPSRRPSFWLPLLLVLSLLLPSAAIWSQPSVPETSAALVKPRHDKPSKHPNHKDAERKSHERDERKAKRQADKPHTHKDAKGKKQATDTLGVNQLLDEPVTDVTPVADATPAVKPTKKERKAARTETAGLVSAAAFAPPAPAQDARMIRYYGAADGSGPTGNGAYFPWQFSNGFDRIEDAQRPVNGKSSHWVVTDCAAFCGWDIYSWRVAGGTASGEANWAQFEVSRPTMVGYVSRDPNAAPSWLAQQGWVDSGIVTSQNPEKGWTSEPKEGHVYTKEFNAGMITIPGPGTGRILPWILFAEAGGARPTMPNGYTPNQPCYVDANGKYDMAAHIADPKYKNRDGYPTWHDNHDLKSWCYHDHEHGSNPALIFGADTNANMPSYGYFDQFPGHKESHQGHKGYAITVWPEADFYVTHHFGTSGVGRFNTCEQRFHLVQVSAMNKAHNALLYQIRFMADYGEVSGFTKVGDAPEDQYTVNPPACPNGNAQAAADAQQGGFQAGLRRESLGAAFNGFTEDGVVYGPWRFAKRYANTLGLTGAFVVNTVDPLDSYQGPADFTIISQLDRSGTGRFFTINETTFGCPNLPATKRNAQGYWFTDMMGLVVYDLATRPADAVRQFCKPGWGGTAVRPAGSPLAAHLGGPAATRWGGLLVPVPSGMPGDFERSIADAHGPNANPVLLYAAEMAR